MKKIQALLIATCLAIPGMAFAQPTTDSTPMSAPSAAPTVPTMAAAPAKKSADDTATSVLKWVGIGAGLLSGLLIGIFGVKKLLRHMSIVQSIRNGVASWNEHAKGTAYKWDDAASKLLLDISDKLLAEGRKELNEKEKPKVLALANAEASIVGPDPTVDLSIKEEEPDKPE